MDALLDSKNFSAFRERLEQMHADGDRDVVSWIVRLLDACTDTEANEALSPVLTPYFFGDTGVVSRYAHASQSDKTIRALRLVCSQSPDAREAMQGGNGAELWRVVCKKGLVACVPVLLGYGVLPDVSQASGACLQALRSWCLLHDQHMHLLTADPRTAVDANLQTLHMFTEGLCNAKRALTDPSNENIMTDAGLDVPDTLLHIDELYEKCRDVLADVAKVHMPAYAKRGR